MTVSKNKNYGGIKVSILNQNDPLVPKTCRKIELPKEDKKALALAITENLPALLVGETGTGKTSAIKELAYLRQQAYVRVNMTGFTTPDELIGSKSVKDGATYYENGIITDAMQRGAILVIDEINATMPDCLFILHGLLDEDRQVTLPNGDVIKPHKDFRVFATCNPDYEGTRSMNKAFLDRFPIILFIDVLKPTQEKELLIKRENIDEKLADNLVTIATMIRKDYLEQKISTFLSTRTLLNLSHLVKQGLSPQEAYRTTVILKTQNREEQKILLDFFLAVFKLAGTVDDGNTPTVITKKELESWKNEGKKWYDKAEEMIKKLGQVEIERDSLLRERTKTVETISKFTVEQEKTDKLIAELTEKVNAYKKLDEIIKKVSHEESLHA